MKITSFGSHSSLNLACQVQNVGEISKKLYFGHTNLIYDNYMFRYDIKIKTSKKPTNCVVYTIKFIQGEPKITSVF